MELVVYVVYKLVIVIKYYVKNLLLRPIHSLSEEVTIEALILSY